MGVGVKKDLIGGQSRCDIGKAELEIHMFPGCQGIGYLVLMVVDQGWWAARAG